MKWTRERQRAYMVKYWEANKDRLADQKRAWFKSPAGVEYLKKRFCSPEYKKQKKEYAASSSGKENRHRAFLKRRYGITDIKYAEMLAGQKGICAICKGVNRSGRRLHVDHDHGTKVVRGLLCGLCNTMLGHARDSSAILSKAARYIKAHAGKTNEP